MGKENRQYPFMTIPREREKIHMKCYECKREVPDEAKFCPKCGSPQKFTKELIDRAVNNDQTAITQLYNMTKDNVYYTIKTMISDEDTAQDLTQDTFLKAMKNLGQLNEPAAFKGWIKKIARNMTIDILRKRKVISFSQMVSSDSDEAIEFEDDRQENLPEVVIDRKETTRLIGEILGTLSPEQRVVTELFYYENLSVKEIAEELGVSENTVKSRLKYARNKIETGVKELEKKGTKLYSLAPIPFLLLLLRSQDAYAADLPNADILLRSMQSGSASADAENDFSGQPADNGNINGGTSKTAAEAVKTGAGAASKGVVTKIIAGIVATVLIGGTIAGIMAHNKESEPQEPTQTEEGDEMSDPSEEKERVEEEEIEEENEEELRHAAYQEILEEYTEAANVELNGNNNDFKQLYGEQYPNVDPIIMNSYLSPANPWNLCYAYYDIDGNGADELLIGVGGDLDVTIIDLYTFDGRQAVKAVTHGSASFTVHTDGMIWECTMSGEEIDTGAEYILKKIADDGYTMEVEHIYTGHYDSQSGTNLTYRDNEQIMWEEFQEAINNAFNSDLDVKDFEWNDLVAKESGIDRFLGTYTKNYGSYSEALILSVEEGALRYAVGNSYHGGWMASRYTEYSINGNELRATTEGVVHTFMLNEDGSITAAFSDIDFYNGVYERNDEYDETEEYSEGYP